MIDQTTESFNNDDLFTVACVAIPALALASIGGIGVVGAFGAIIAAVMSVLRFIADLFFTVLAVIGCPAESIATRARNMLSYSVSPTSTSVSPDGHGGIEGGIDLERGSSSRPPWVSGSHYSPIATGETETTSAQAPATSSTGGATGLGDREESAPKADRAALLAAAEARARGHKV